MPIIGAGQGDCCAHAPAVTQNTRRFLVQFDGIILPPFVPPAGVLQLIWGGGWMQAQRMLAHEFCQQGTRTGLCMPQKGAQMA